MALLRSLWVALGLRSEAFESGIRRAEGSISSFSKGVAYANRGSNDFYRTMSSFVRVGVYTRLIAGSADAITAMGKAAREGATDLQLVGMGLDAFANKIPLVNTLVDSSKNLYKELSGINAETERLAKNAAILNSLGSGIASIGKGLSRSLEVLRASEKDRERVTIMQEFRDELEKIHSEQAKIVSLSPPTTGKASWETFTPEVKRKMTETADLVRAAKEKRNLALQRLDAEQRKETITGIEKAIEANGSWLISLERERKALGASRGELILREARIRRLNGAELEWAETEARLVDKHDQLAAGRSRTVKRLDEIGDALRKSREEMKAAEEELRTPLQVYWDEVTRLQKLLDKGLSFSAFTEGMKRAKEQLKSSGFFGEKPSQGGYAYEVPAYIKVGAPNDVMGGTNPVVAKLEDQKVVLVKIGEGVSNLVRIYERWFGK